ncbi:hypothetical protein [Polaribacter marinivivus]|uniref:Uncharacterized protein n=1 Tax=Polaribacter marinivivus TaxID=1524260 RepID=A0ABV8R9D5_9FLAO
MRDIKKRSRNFLFIVSNLEKKHKVITYVSLLFLTVSTYFLRTENQKVKIDFATLKERNESLTRNMVIFNRNYENFPQPVWQKIKQGDEFIMKYVNPEYVNRIGHLFNYDKYEQIGKNNFENFGPSYGQKYQENDMSVSISGKELETIEETTDKDGKLIYIKSIKWRDINDNKDTLVYGMIKDFIKPEDINFEDKKSLN